MKIIPLTIQDAKDFVKKYHRHHEPPVSALFAIGLEDKGILVGCAMVGRPVARMLQDKFTCEVIRLTTNGVHNGCSMLYSASARIAKEMGYRRIVTYILESEYGSSLKATGWKNTIQSRGGSWSRPSRPRIDKHPIGPKQRYEKILSYDKTKYPTVSEGQKEDKLLRWA